MITKILEKSETMAGILDYNYNKVKEGTARVVCVSNLANTDETSVRQRFRWLENGNISSKHVAFHLAINPNPNSPREKLTDPEVEGYAMALMKALGMSEQPYVIFEHNDIDRTHYHLVSIRIKEDGHQIGCFHDRSIIKQTSLKLQDKYHFTYGKELKNEKTNIIGPLGMLRHAWNGDKPIRFMAGKDVKAQFHLAVERCLKYSFSSFTQFAALMDECGFRVKISHGKGVTSLAYQGLDRNGRPATSFIKDDPLGPSLYAKVEVAAKKDQGYAKYRPDVLIAIKKTLEQCLRSTKNEEQFVTAASKYGLGVHFGRDDEGQIKQVIIIDRQNKRVYKGSDISRGMTAKNFQLLIENGGWGHSETGKRASAPALGIGVSQGANNSDSSKKEGLSESSMVSLPSLNDLLDILFVHVPSHVGSSKGKDPKKEQKKVRRAKYL